MSSDWLDVSLPISSSMPVFPGDPAVTLEPVSVPEGAPYRLSHMAMGSHTGTHVDAPAHFIRGGKALGDIPLSRWNGPCWVVEVTTPGDVTAATLDAVWPQVVVERLLLKTPNSALWGTPEAGKTYQAITPDAAQRLVERGVGLIGIDSLSIERDTDGTFPVHHALLGHDILIVEGLDLTHIAPGPYDLVCMPLKLTTPDGAPARIALRPR